MKLTLTVQEVDKEDVYKDIVRVPEKHRLDVDGHLVREGSVCRVATSGKWVYAIVRGCGKSEEQIIKIDGRLRDDLGVTPDSTVEVTLTVQGWWGQFWWAWDASDAAYRIAARMGLLSVLLGLAGFLLGLIGLGVSIYPMIKC
jgi:hypothetical protein